MVGAVRILADTGKKQLQSGGRFCKLLLLTPALPNQAAAPASNAVINRTSASSGSVNPQGKKCVSFFIPALCGRKHPRSPGNVTESGQVRRKGQAGTEFQRGLRGEAKKRRQCPCTTAVIR